MHQWHECICILHLNHTLVPAVDKFGLNADDILPLLWSSGGTGGLVFLERLILPATLLSAPLLSVLHHNDILRIAHCVRLHGRPAP
jgi:hypothetical protein